MTANTNIRVKRRTRNYYRNVEITQMILEKMTNEELREVFLDIRSFINKGKRYNKDVRNKEIEMCYIQREMQFRKLHKNKN